MNTFVLALETDNGIVIDAVMHDGTGVKKAYAAVVNLPLKDLMATAAKDVAESVEDYEGRTDRKYVRNILREFGDTNMGDIVLVCPHCGSTDIIPPVKRVPRWDCDGCGASGFTPVTYNKYHGGNDE